jgi:ribosomal-protein-alanine N-acetyltransferase
MGSIGPDEVLLTERCRLRQPSDADIAHVWSATRVDGFNEGMRWDPPDGIEELKRPLRANREDWERGTNYSFTVESRDGRVFIGRIQVRQESDPELWTLGFWTHPDQQGKGYASEAAEAILDFAFRRLGARVVGAAHATWNDASRKVLERIGMRFVRSNPRGFQKRGAWVEEQEYELRAPGQG